MSHLEPHRELQQSVSPAQDRERRIRRIRSLARLMDEAFQVPGTNYRIGLDSIIGLVPGVGDAITAGFAFYLIRESAALGVPRRILARMIWNAGIDLVGGTIPVAGDLFDVAWKANKKNVRLLERWLQSQGQQPIEAHAEPVRRF